MSDEDEPRDAVTRRDGDVEASVAVQETWMGSIQFDALLVNDKHRYLRAVLGGIEDLTEIDNRLIIKWFSGKKILTYLKYIQI